MDDSPKDPKIAGLLLEKGSYFARYYLTLVNILKGKTNGKEKMGLDFFGAVSGARFQCQFGGGSEPM